MKKSILRILILSGAMIAIGISDMPYLNIVSAFGLGTLFVVNIFLLSRGRGLKWSGFRYTRARYYLLLFFLLAPLIILRPQLSFWMKFVAFGILGIIGECLFSFHWEQVFGEKIWIYRKDTIFSGHSSWPNVVPWGLGGLFYELLTKKMLYAPTAAALLTFWVISLAIFLVVSVWRNLKNNIQPTSRSLTFPGYVIFFLPYIGALALTSMLLGYYHIIVAALLYSVGGWVAEYFWGRIVAFILTDKLWVYVPDPMDNGHLTVWSLLLFMVAGFWLVSISHVFTYC